MQPNTRRSTRALVLSASALAACQGELPSGDPPLGAGGGPGGVPTLALEPAAALDEAPRVVRLVIAVPGAARLDPGRFVLVEGELGPAHLRQLADEDLSDATLERVVPSLAWRLDGDGDGAPAVVLAPAQVLEPGELYTLGAGEPELAIPFTVAAEDAAPLLERVWPRPGESATAGLAIWCGDAPLAPVEVAASLAPGGASGAIRGGVAPGLGARCVRFEADPGQVGAAVGDGPWAPPPFVDLGEAVARLDPRPLAKELDAAPGAAGPASCAVDEVAFGPGCARVLDDRILARGALVPLLWAVGGSALDHVQVVGPGEPFVIGPLPPQSSVPLEVCWVDAAGATSRTSIVAVTAAPMAHLVVNEVLANPVGAEPAQEWVELFNDGVMGAQLAEYTLEDGGGVTPLPEMTLPPGAFALVVNEGYVDLGSGDAPAAPGTTIVRVSKLGKNGLSNSGEPLALRHLGGAVVSAFPPAPTGKAGESVARVHPTAPDGLASSFVVGPPTPGAASAGEP